MALEYEQVRFCHAAVFLSLLMHHQKLEVDLKLHDTDKEAFKPKAQTPCALNRRVGNMLC